MNLRKTLFILPNLFTLSSIFCGFYATLLCLGDPGADVLHRAAFLIVYAMIFDTLDGRVARLTKTQSAFGVQFDSLADVLSFGVAPAVLVYRWSLHLLDGVGIAVAFIFVAAGTIRLARFNVLAMGPAPSPSGKSASDEPSAPVKAVPKKPGKYILGLPIPGAAGILVALVVANHAVEGVLPLGPSVVLSIVLTLSFFMVSTVKFRSFKDLRPNGRTLVFVAVALISSAIIARSLHFSFALLWLLGSYVVIAVAETLYNLSRRGLHKLSAGSSDE